MYSIAPLRTEWVTRSQVWAAYLTHWLRHCSPAAQVQFEPDFDDGDFSSEQPPPSIPGQKPTYMGSFVQAPATQFDPSIHTTTKALQQHIYGVSSREDLLKLGTSAAGQLDPQSLVSLVKRWAMLPDKPTPRTETEFFELVEDKFINALSPFGPRDLSRISYYLGVTIGRKPSPEFMEELTWRVTAKLDSFELAFLTRVLFTYAKLGYRHQGLFAKICRRLADRATDLDARDMGMVAYAAARLRFKEPRLLGHMAAVAAKKLPDFTPKGLTTLVWGLGALEADVDPHVVRQIATYVGPRLASYRLSEMGNVLFGLAHLQALDTETLNRAADVAAANGASLTPEDVATLSWSFARVSYTERPALTATFARHVASHARSYTAKQLATSAQALGELGCPDEAAEAASSAVAEQMAGRLAGAMELQHVVNAAWGVALMGGTGHRSVVQALTRQVGDKVLKDVDGYRARVCILPGDFTNEMEPLLRNPTQSSLSGKPKVGELTPHQVIKVLRTCAAFQEYDTDLFRNLSRRVFPILHKMSFQNTTRIVWSLAAQDVYHTKVFDRVAASQAERVKYADRADVEAAFHVFTRYKVVVEEQGGRVLPAVDDFLHALGSRVIRSATSPHGAAEAE